MENEFIYKISLISFLWSYFFKFSKEKWRRRDSPCASLLTSRLRRALLLLGLGALVRLLIVVDGLLTVLRQPQRHLQVPQYLRLLGLDEWEPVMEGGEVGEGEVQVGVEAQHDNLLEVGGVQVRHHVK